VADVITIDRSRWLGYRWQRHGLAGGSSKDVLDDLLLLGLQDSRPVGSTQSLFARASKIGSTGVANAITPDGPLVTMWSVRGAPHTHRVNQLDVARDALAPQETDDGGKAFVKAVEEVADALRAVVKSRTAKGDASAEVARRVSNSLVNWCERCKARHVPDGVFRAAGRQAQVVLGPEEQRATILYPKPKHKQDKAGDPRLDLLEAFFRVNGPTTRNTYREWMDGGTATVGEVWEKLGDGLVRVQVDGKRHDLPEALVSAVSKASKPSGVALVPPSDPYLKQVDRTLLVPEARRRKEIWKALSGPGALLIDGEVAGTWRYRRSDKELTITPFDSVPAAQRAKAEESAALVAEATGDDQPTVTWG
jgi:hypothetical protein